jgi:hypothetical protein
MKNGYAMHGVPREAQGFLKEINTTRKIQLKYKRRERTKQ